MTFASDMGKIKANLVDRSDRLVQGVVTNFANAFVDKSPVDTGLFRGNWMFSPEIDALMYPVTVSEVDPIGTATKTRLATAIQSLKAGGYSYVYNAVPYSEFLEAGGSKQAPVGVVGVTVLELQPRVRRVLAGL